MEERDPFAPILAFNASANIYSIVFSIFLTALKLFGKINLHWALVFSPIWLKVITSIVFIAIYILLTLIKEKREGRT